MPEATSVPVPGVKITPGGLKHWHSMPQASAPVPGVKIAEIPEGLRHCSTVWYGKIIFLKCKYKV